MADLGASVEGQARRLEDLHERALAASAADDIPTIVFTSGEGLALAQELGDTRRQVAFLLALGQAACFWRPPWGLAHLKKAADLSRELGDPALLVAALSALGQHYELLGDKASASACFREMQTLADSHEEEAIERRSPLAAAAEGTGENSAAHVELQIVSAVSGNVILGPTRWTRSSLDVRELSRAAGTDLRAYKAVQGAQAVPLHGLRVAELPDGICRVLRRPCHDYLVNAWRPSDETRPGWRRWYKEFVEFSAQVSPLYGCGEAAQGWLRGDGLEQPFRLGNASVRSLIPCILQALAWDIREDDLQDYHLRPRPWEGALHAIVLRSGTPYPVVQQWVRSWCRENVEIIEAVRDAVARAGSRCYFS